MTRTDMAARVVPSTPSGVYEALTDAHALLRWLPPPGMTARLCEFDARVGGGYRMTLTYREPPEGGGKTNGDSDEVTVRFLALEPTRKVVQEVSFASDDPAYDGTMTMTWSLAVAADGTEVTVRCDDVPPGIDPEEHLTGLAESLSQLAEYLG